MGVPTETRSPSADIALIAEQLELAGLSGWTRLRYHGRLLLCEERELRERCARYEGELARLAAALETAQAAVKPGATRTALEPEIRNEMRAAATMARDSGFDSVRIDPAHLIALLDKPEGA